MGNIDSHHHEAANHGTEELIQVSETTNHETETLLHVTESSNNGTELSHHMTTNQIRGSDFHVTEITKMASESADVDTDTETDMMTSEDQHSGEFWTMKIFVSHSSACNEDIVFKIQ